jgi:hypothetical protein
VVTNVSEESVASIIRVKTEETTIDVTTMKTSNLR